MNANSNALDFRDPGTMSEELLSVPGFVNELKDYTLAVSPRPNPPLAFAGALAMLTHLTGRSYIDERGSHTNLYLAALAPTAMGKDEPRVTKKMLYEAQFNVSEGSFDRLKQRFVAQLVKAGGQLDRSTRLKNLHVDVTTFQRIVLTLHACDMIEEELLSRRKTLYTLKSAA